MTPRATAPKSLPGWVYGGTIGCTIIICWLAWHNYRPASAEEQARLKQQVGGETALATIANADRVYATRLGLREDRDRAAGLDDYELIGEPFEVHDPERAELKQLLTSPRNYRWDVKTGCVPNYGFRLRFVRKDDAVEAWVCLECSQLLFVFNDHKDQPGGAHFYPMRQAMTRLAGRLFPDDGAIAEAME